MIWAVSQRYTPKAGDTRITVHRAWLPKRLNAAVIWLGQYERYEVWKSEMISAIVGGQQKVFEIGEWITVYESPVKWIRA